MIETAKTLARGNPWAFQVWLESLTVEEQRLVYFALVSERLRTAILEIFEYIREAFQKIIQALTEFAAALIGSRPRLSLFVKLHIHWHLPMRLAWRLAKHWPQPLLG